MTERLREPERHEPASVDHRCALLESLTQITALVGTEESGGAFRAGDIVSELTMLGGHYKAARVFSPRTPFTGTDGKLHEGRLTLIPKGSDRKSPVVKYEFVHDQDMGPLVSSHRDYADGTVIQNPQITAGEAEEVQLVLDQLRDAANEQLVGRAVAAATAEVYDI